MSQRSQVDWFSVNLAEGKHTQMMDSLMAAGLLFSLSCSIRNASVEEMEQTFFSAFEIVEDQFILLSVMWNTVRGSRCGQLTRSIGAFAV